jgi:hypothetical protein
MLFVFLPFLGRVTMFCVSILKFIARHFMFKNEEDEEEKLYPNKMTEFKVLLRRFQGLVWHFPPIIILR